MKKLVTKIAIAAACAFGVCGGLVACDTTTSSSSSSSIVTPSAISDARAYVFALYRNEKTEKTADFERITSWAKDTETFTITWTVEVKSGSTEAVKVGEPKDGKVTITVDPTTGEEVKFNLTALITSNVYEASDTILYEYTVPIPTKMTSKEFYEAKDDTVMSGEGVVSAIISKSRNGCTANGLYIQDSVGGFYIYGLGSDPSSDLELNIGDKVTFVGKKSTYSDQPEAINAQVKKVGQGTLTPVDYTESFKKLTSSSDKTFMPDQNSYVEIKGVEVLPQDESAQANGYYKWKLDGKTSYLRISGSVCPLTKAEQTTFIAEHNSHVGWTANVKGVINNYSGAFYLTPCGPDAITYVSLPERTDEEALAFELNNLRLEKTAFGDDAEFTVPVKGAGYERVAIAWASDSPAVAVDGNKVSVKLGEEPATAKLTATLTCGAHTATKEFNLELDAASTDLFIPVAMPEATLGTFKLALNQANLGKYLFADGKLNDSEYLTTTDKSAKAADFKVTAGTNDGEYIVKLGDKFVEVYENGSQKVRIRLADSSSTPWKWNEECKLFTMTLAGCAKDSNNGEYYLGTYSTYNTISASKTSYITGDNAKNVGVSQFPAYLSVLIPAGEKITPITSPAAGVHKFALTQANLGKDLYADGKLNDSEYLTTTDKSAKAADFEVVAGDAEGEFKIKLGDKFVEVYENGSQKVRIRLADSSSTPWKWNEECKLFTMTLAGCAKDSNNGEYYLGTYNTYNTISASKTSYITGDNAKNVGVSQFPAYICDLVLTRKEYVPMEEPTTGSFLGALGQSNLGLLLFADGKLNDSEYLTTSNLPSKAVRFEIVAGDAEGEFKIKLGDKFVEVYENGSQKVRIRLADSSSTPWKWNSEAGVFTMTLAGCAKDSNNGEYYLGTYSTYNTISASKTSYITGDNAKNVGVSQFPLYYGDLVFMSE